MVKRIRPRMILAAVSVAAMAAGGVVGLAGMASAAQDPGTMPATPSQRVVLEAGLAPSVPTDQPIFGAAAGSIPWVIKDGNVRLGSGGALQVNVTGLVDPETGVNPLPDLAVSVYCNGSLAATTAPVPFSSSGNARVHTVVQLPAFCPAPAVLVNPATGPTAADVHAGVYIAFDSTVMP